MGRLHVVAGALVIFTAVTITKGEDALCYYDVGKAAPPEYIPCAEPKDGVHHHCCKRGNKCMEQSTCFDFATYVTYQIGCSDPSYEDSSCPAKCGLDREKGIWVGLVLCNDEEWACNHPDTCGNKCAPNEPWDELIQTLPAMTCSDLWPRKVAFTAGSRLIDMTTLPVVGLPWTTSGSPSRTSFTRDRETQSATHNTVATSSDVESTLRPGAPETATATATGSTPATPISTSSGEPTEEDNSNPKTLAIGLGTGIPLLFVLAGALLFLYLRRRRRSKYKSDFADSATPNENEKSGPLYSPADTNPTPLSAYPKSELPADETSTRHELHSPCPSAELAGLTVDERSSAAFSPVTTYTGSPELRSPVSAMSASFASGRDSGIPEENESAVRANGGFVYQAYPATTETRPKAAGGLRIVNEDVDRQDFAGETISPVTGGGSQKGALRGNNAYELPG